MIKILYLNNEKIKELKKSKNIESHESTIYKFNLNNEKKVLKLFKNENSICNKVIKMLLMNERLNDNNKIVTFDCLAINPDEEKIIGYVMPFIEGNLYSCESELDIKDKINILKQIPDILNKAHKHNIICADFQKNIIVNKDGLHFIDYDNFAVDSYKVDLMNRYSHIYSFCTKKMDKNVDYYLLNLMTIASINNLIMPKIYYEYENNKDSFVFNCDEINNIVEKTMNIDKNYIPELIIDKINSKDDLEKIKHKIKK